MYSVCSRDERATLVWIHSGALSERNNWSNSSYVALHVRGALASSWDFDSNYEEHGGQKTSLQPSEMPQKQHSTRPAFTLGYKAAQPETTNLFDSPRRVQTDSILDLWRFQGKSVWHIHTQHCHYSEMFPSVIVSWLSNVSAGGN